MEFGDTLLNIATGMNPEWGQSYWSAMRSKQGIQNDQALNEAQTAAANARKQRDEQDARAKALEEKRLKGMKAAQLMSLASQMGNRDMFNQAYSEVSGLINDGEQYEGMAQDPSSGMPVFKAKDSVSGQAVVFPANNQSMRELSSQVRKIFQDPESYFKEIDANNKEISTFNQSAQWSEIDKDGRLTQRQQRDPETGNVYYEVMDRNTGKVTRSEIPHRTLEASQKAKKGDAELEKIQSEVAENYSTVGANQALAGQRNAAAELNRANTEKVKATAPAESKDAEVVNKIKNDLEGAVYKTYQDGPPGEKSTKKDFVPLDDTQLRSRRRAALSQGFDIEVDVYTDKKGKTQIAGYSVVPAAAIGRGDPLPKLQRNFAGKSSKQKTGGQPPAGFKPDPQGRTVNGKPAYISEDGKRVWY